MSNKIPVAVRNAVWNTYIGVNIGSTYCPIGCGSTIDRGNFECGHIVSRKNKGSDTIENLRPICSTCNKSMSTKNMIEFINMYRFNSPLYDNGGPRPMDLST